MPLGNGKHFNERESMNEEFQQRVTYYIIVNVMNAWI